MHIHEYDWVAQRNKDRAYHRLCACGFNRDAPAWRVLVTGSREHRDAPLICQALMAELRVARRLMRPMVVIHGAAKGLDTIAHCWAIGADRTTPDPHPANWAAGKQAGHVRNQKMVDLGADVCLAFPLPGSTGTWDCVRRAKAAGIPTKILEQ